MAQQKKRPSSNSSTRKKSTSNNKNNSRSVSRKVQKQPTKDVGFIDYFHWFQKTRIFKPLMILLSIVVVVLLDMLISWNEFQKFFMILGTEILIIALIFTLRLALSINSEQKNEEKK